MACVDKFQQNSQYQILLRTVHRSWSFSCLHTSSGAEEMTSIWVLQQCEGTYKLFNCDVRFM